MSYLLLNFKKPELANLKVRQALAQAIDRDEMIRYKLQGLAVPATSLMTPASPFYIKDLKNLSYDLEAARRSFQESGVKNLSLTLKTSNDQTAIENGKVIAHQLAKIGINVKLQSYEWGTFYSDVKKGNFELATMRWVGNFEPDLYRIAFHSREVPPGRNRGSYINRSLDPLLDEGLRIANFQKRFEHYRKIQTIVLQDLPIIPLWYNTQVEVVHKRVKDYEPPTNGDFSGLIKAWK
jgi:peptide/nickel transport system substrate-binding protein